ncbi:hypothetical protein SAMN07250955_10329 [Arboricoccus pini]|uniref:Uncharacterized protein n=1 Tax=Arboricoccus pini TaxID=1963835 RepID=A0A212QR74_9PROT|nr:hypothetical protein [Arboricoccus pini]SNB62076.1 hypothetical protein SAMN07250955_10329 [Arboricoccus pini]
MDERYWGEQTCLRSFLTDLLPVVESRLGPSALLYHAVKRGLRRGDLEAMRTARRMFNHLSRPQRQALSAGIVDRSRERAAARKRGMELP